MKWIDKMVERITRKETALNDHFCVNRHTVVCQSGMTDYVSVIPMVLISIFGQNNFVLRRTVNIARR